MFRLILLRVFESYFRHRWLYLLPLVLLLAVGIVYVSIQKPKYVSQGIMYVQYESYLASLTAVRAPDAPVWLTASQATAQEINDLMYTDAFLRAVIQQTDLEVSMDQGDEAIESLFQAARESVRVAPQGNNQVFVGAATDDPKISYQLVSAIIESYLQWRINGQRAESESAHNFFVDLLSQYQADLDSARDELTAYLAAHPEPLQGDRPVSETLEIQRLQNQVDFTTSRVSTLLDKDESALLSLAQIESDARQTYILIDAPRIPDNPERSRKEIALQVGIFAVSGMVLSILMILSNALLDRTFRFSSDIQIGLDLPVLAMIPLRQSQKPGEQVLVADELPEPKTILLENEAQYN